MGKGFKHGMMGSIALNYRIVGGTAAPEQPRENTLWVSTDTVITDHIFAPDQPQGAEGRVWIRTGLSGDIRFNLLKKNAVLVTPLSASVYANGQWTSREIRIWQEGSWKKTWDGHLFAPGNLCEDITGGWTDIAEGADCIYCFASEKQDYGISVSCQTRKPVDLTNYSKLRVTVDTYSETFRVSLLDSAGTAAASVSAAAAGTLTLDISRVTGSYYVELYAYGHDHGTEGDSYASATFTVSDIYLM